MLSKNQRLYVYTGSDTRPAPYGRSFFLTSVKGVNIICLKGKKSWMIRQLKTRESREEGWSIAAQVKTGDSSTVSTISQAAGQREESPANEGVFMNAAPVGSEWVNGQVYVLMMPDCL